MLTTELKAMHAEYITALGEANVDARILNYVAALIEKNHALDSELYMTRVELEDWKAKGGRLYDTTIELEKQLKEAREND